MKNESNYEYIELYKNRTLGERFSASAGFIRQNWKVMGKSLIYIGLPLALVMGYFMQQSTNNIFSVFEGLLNNDISAFESYPFVMYGSPIAQSLYTLAMALFSLFIIGTTGAILRKYKSGPLGEDSIFKTSTSWATRIAGQVFVQGLIFVLGLIILIIVGAVIIAMFSAIGGMIVTGIIGSVLLFILMGGMFALISPLSLICYPIIFEDASAWEGIKKGFRLGFRYWGSTFLTAFLAGLIMGIVNYILAIPSIVYGLITMGDTGFFGFLLSSVSTLSILVIMPVYFVFLAFQYTSIVEREEGISLQNRIDEFDRL